MYSVNKLNKQSDNIQPWHNSFPNLEPVHCSMSGSNCCFLTCTQVLQEARNVVWYSHLLKNFPQVVVIHTVKGFSIVNELKVDNFLEFFCFFYDATDVGILISGSFAFSKSSCTSGNSWFHALSKFSLEDFELYFTSMWDACNCGIVWTLFGIAFLWDWNENWTFLVPWPLLAYWMQHLNRIIS